MSPNWPFQVAGLTSVGTQEFADNKRSTAVLATFKPK